jgi:hypothetical protein
MSALQAAAAVRRPPLDGAHRADGRVPGRAAGARQSGRLQQKQMNALLRAYMEAHR